MSRGLCVAESGVFPGCAAQGIGGGSGFSTYLSALNSWSLFVMGFYRRAHPSHPGNNRQLSKRC